MKSESANAPRTSAELNLKEAELLRLIAAFNSVVVAYSGGVDSSLLAYYARKALDRNAKIVIAISPSLAEDDLAAARRQAEQCQWDLIEIRTEEFDLPEYQRNDAMRCYFCKATLFDQLAKFARDNHISAIAYGANLDDALDYRPGRLAAREYDVHAPLADAGLGKAEIRALARLAGLPSWDRPQNACLSSRVLTNIPVTVQTVSQVEAAEAYVKSLGFKVVRVRHHGDRAVLEIGQDELPAMKAAPDLVRKISDKLRQLGYSGVAIDPQGYRQGGGMETAL